MRWNKDLEDAQYITCSDGKTELSWQPDDLQGRTLILEGRPAHCGKGLWSTVATIDTAESKLDWLSPRWKDDPLVFEAVHDICMVCAGEVFAA